MAKLVHINPDSITSKIHILRGEKIMFDFDLAVLYNVENRALKQAVRRNKKRFPSDFMFEVNTKEIDNMVSQNVIPSKKVLGGAKPMAFTEQGVAMLSGILNSDRAVKVNIAIMRAFVQMRVWVTEHKELAKKIAELEKKYDGNFSKVFQALNQLMAVPQKDKREIGFKLPHKD